MSHNHKSTPTSVLAFMSYTGKREEEHESGNTCPRNPVKRCYRSFPKCGICEEPIRGQFERSLLVLEKKPK